jgi:hypothetical protein
MQPGTPEHKELFCSAFLNTHEPYEPEALPWPGLDDKTLALLRSVPIWNFALQAETNAGLMLTRFAESEADPLIRRVLQLQADEETRHARLFTELVRRYGLGATARDDKVLVTRQAFIDFGCRECLHAFLGFGAYRLAQQSRFVPETLLSLFERLMGEEARHIVFFVNWLAYERASGRAGPTMVAMAPAALGYARMFLGVLRGAGDVRTQAEAVPVSGRTLPELSPALFLQTCLSENERWMARFDPRLVRPRFLPDTARVALRLIERVNWAQEVGRVLRGEPALEVPSRRRAPAMDSNVRAAGSGS